MASDTRVFDAACRQAGIVQVNTTIDLLDMSAALSSLPLSKGPRTAVVTLGGGWGVVTADQCMSQCMSHGLVLADLAEGLIGRFDQVLPSFWGRANPIDLVGQINYQNALSVIEDLLQWDGCDVVIHLGVHGLIVTLKKLSKSASTVCRSDYTQADLEAIEAAVEKQERDYVDGLIRLTDRYEKPIVGVGLMSDARSRTLHRLSHGKYKGVFFPTPERAVKAVAGMCRYAKWRNRQP